MFVDQLNDPEEYKEMGILLTDKEGHFVSLDFWNDYIDALIFPLFHVLAQPGFRAHIKLEEAKIKKTPKKATKTTESQRPRIFVPEDVTQDGNSLYRFGTFTYYFLCFFTFHLIGLSRTIFVVPTRFTMLLFFVTPQCTDLENF